MRSRAACTRRPSRPGRDSPPREGPDAMKIRTRSAVAKPALLEAPDAYDERVATVLVSARKAEPYRIDAVRDSGGEGTLAERLIAAGVVTDEELASTLAEHYRVEVLDFRHTDPEPEAVALLQVDAARSLRALPIKVLDDAVVVGVVDPSPEHVAAVA